MEWTLYIRPGCHLCEDATAWLDELAAAAGAHLQLINILDDHAVYEAYKWRIPVLKIGTRLWDAPLDPAAVSAEVLRMQG